MEKIWKSNPSELVGPASRSIDELLILKLHFTVTLTCSCLSCTAGLTWSLGGLPPEFSDTCLVGIRGSENVCSKVKIKRVDGYREKDAAFLRAPTTLASES